MLMAMLAKTVDHLVNDVIASAKDYDAAERALTDAWERTKDLAQCGAEAREAKRRAAQVAIAIDGLADRAKDELGISIDQVRTQVAALCEIDGTKRDGCLDRVRGVANAYKHQSLNDPRLPILSNDDVLAAGLGYGLDGYGIGKCSGVEIIVHEKGGDRWKFLGDVPWAIAGWFRYLRYHGATIPPARYEACSLRVDDGPPAP
jgi:hypothetical protein